MRKRSPATQLRYAKREIDNLKLALRITTEELKQRRQVGKRLATICFNVSYLDRGITDADKHCMTQAFGDWDSIPDNRDLDKMLDAYGGKL